MRLSTFLGATTKEAMTALRSGLGEEAVILATRTLDDGQVQITGALSDDEGDLADILEPSEDARNLDWLSGLLQFHEWPLALQDRIKPSLQKVRPADPEAVLTTLLQALLHFGRLQNAERRPLLLSGPPGCGKTTTIAKLAAAQVLAGGTVDIVTLDLERAGGLDQLNTLLDPLDVQPIPIAELTDLPRAVSMCSADMVLLDSPGTNAFNPADLASLSALVEKSRAEPILVLPAGQSYANSRDIGRSYVALGARSMVVTKLDAAGRLGGIIGAAEIGLTLTEAGISPTIGNGLCPLSADGLARLLLRRYRSSLGEEICP